MTDPNTIPFAPETQDHADGGTPHNVPVLQKKLSEVIAEYDGKLASIGTEIEEFEKAGDRLKTVSCIAGTWGDVSINTGSIYSRTLEQSLLNSAWRHVYNLLQIETIAPASDRSRFKQGMSNPPPFTLDNIRATFGEYLLNPLDNILRGLAEVFSSLDPAYMSHDRMKIGVAGLPKRVIISHVTNEYGSSGYGTDRLKDIINALAAYQRKPLIEWQELRDIVEDGEHAATSRGITLKRFGNGNGHLHFSPETLRDINRALAEYYGEVLPDCHQAKPDQPRASTAVSKDLQYYPTPQDVVERILDTLSYLKDSLILEPSCGCGRIMDGLRQHGAKVFGVEVDPARAQQARDKGHAVMTANFLEVEPIPKYDRVVMNPPFYGKHYAKHVEHALKFLKPDGALTAILPITARYDHGLLNGRWSDLPVGSFRDSGTNINTTVLTMRKEH
jgi:Domain of unknown function (DUF4942)/Uncharacterised methyltransferase family (DUF6094)